LKPLESQGRGFTHGHEKNPPTPLRGQEGVVENLAWDPSVVSPGRPKTELPTGLGDFPKLFIPPKGPQKKHSKSTSIFERFWLPK